MTANLRISLNPMKCQELARRIESLQPQAEPRDVARYCLLLSNLLEDTNSLENDEALIEAWKEVNLRWQATSDQHAAVTEELENLAKSDPKRFTPDQLWILIRAIKVQSQILQLYIGDEALTVQAEFVVGVVVDAAPDAVLGQCAGTAADLAEPGEAPA